MLGWGNDSGCLFIFLLGIRLLIQTEYTPMKHIISSRNSGKRNDLVQSEVNLDESSQFICDACVDDPCICFKSKD